MRTLHPWALPTQPTTKALLLAAGVTRGMIDAQLRAGKLMSPRRGVYLGSDAWPIEPGPRHLVLAHAEQVANPGAVMSHASAATYWMLPSPSFQDWHDEPVCVTMPPGRGHGSQQRTARHRVIALPPEHITRDTTGYDVTTIARTAVDVAVHRPLPEALTILDGAGRRLIETYLENPRRTDYGNPRLARAAREEMLVATGRGTALTPYINLADPARESAAESLSAGHLIVAGLPTPLYQARIDSVAGSIYPDFLWPELRVIGEVDGAIKYGDTASILKEKRREQVLLDLGYVVVRWLASEIMLTPWVVVERMSRALRL